MHDLTATRKRRGPALQPAIKLTKAQARTLLEAAADEFGFRCIRTYKPAVRLIELGLAKWAITRMLRHGWLVITEAGHKLAKELRETT